MIPIRQWLLVPGALAAGVLLVVACSEDELRDPFVPTSDAADEPAPNLPDAAAPFDAARAPDLFDASAEPVVCATSPCAVELTSGRYHFCARFEGGTVQCWGDDTGGALGGGPLPDGDDGGRSGPVRVSSLSGVIQLSAAGRSTCARLESGTTQCWGDNSRGQLGIHGAEPFADTDDHPIPIPIAFGPLARVDVGLASTCGTNDDGSVFCWGDNSKGQLTRPELGTVAGPTPAEALTGIVRTGASEVTAYALGRGGALFTWGAVSGRPSPFDVDPYPAKIPSLDDVHDLAVSEVHACAIVRGEVRCWGAKGAPLCTGLPDAEREPKAAPLYGEVRAQQISVSRNTTCVRLTTGALQCCDRDAGASPLAFRPAPALGGVAVHVATADETTCALLRDGAVSCWGGNAHGELGGGSRDDAPHPTPTKVTFR